MICAKCGRVTPVNHLKWAEGSGGKRHEVWDCPARDLAAQPRPKLEKVRELIEELAVDCRIHKGAGRVTVNPYILEPMLDAALAELDAAERGE